MRSYPLSYRLLSLTLALLVLAASIGLPVQRRTCRLSGRSTVHVAWQLKADPSAQSRRAHSLPSFLASGCYAYSLELHQLSTPAQEAAAGKQLTAAPGPLALPSATSAFLPATSGLAASLKPAALPAFPTPPPRPGGRILLVRIGLLVV